MPQSFVQSALLAPGSPGSSLSERARGIARPTAEGYTQLVLDYQEQVRLSETARTRRQKAEAAELAEKYLELIVLYSIGLVRTIAKEVLSSKNLKEQHSVYLEELVNEGALAVCQAARKFDPEKVPLFTKYFPQAVRHELRSSDALEGSVSIPLSWHRVKRSAAAARVELESSLGRPPTIDELREDLLKHSFAWAESRLSVEDRKLPKAERTKVMERALRKQGTLGAIDNLDQILNHLRGASSLDAQIGNSSDQGGATVGDLITDTGTEQPEIAFAEKEAKSAAHEALGAALESLDERDRKILMLRFGFIETELMDEDGTHTFSAIATMFGISAERIRQLNAQALAQVSRTLGTDISDLL